MSRALLRIGLVLGALAAFVRLAPDVAAQAVALFQGVVLGTASSQTGFLDLYSAGAAHRTRIQAADTPTAAVTWKLPPADLGATGFLQSNGSGVLSVVAGVTPFFDNVDLLKDDGDPTKLLRFQLSGITTGNTVTPFAFSGTAAAPAVSISSGVSIESNRMVILETATFGFGATLLNPPNAFWSRDGAGEIQQGADINGTGTNQVYKGPDGITGTDRIGGGLTLRPGRGTGAAVSAPLTIDRQITKATGTTAQTYAPAVIVCPTKILSNTSATAQTIATITTTSASGGTVTMEYTTTASNGTLVDTDSGKVKVSWNNNAGTVAAAMSAVSMQSDSDASGTLATTPTATVATNVVSVKFTPTWVTIVPTVVTGYATFLVNSAADTVVCQ